MTMTTATLTAHARDDGRVPGDGDDPAKKPVRRQFSAAYKLAIIDEYERATDPGAKGALLRREGLYTSHIVEWRKARDAGASGGLAAKHRKKRTDTERELERLRKRNERLEDQLTKHKKALAIQGKASELLARLLAESEDTETRQQP